MNIKSLPIEGIAMTSQARAGGEHHFAEFPNGYDASVYRHSDGIGGYHVAVLVDGDVCYDTQITDDVVECRTVEDVAAVLLRISRLPAR